MARTADVEKRAELLRRVVAHLEEHGLSGFSLAPLAAGVGTTKRMLLYYFGARDALIGEVLAVSRPDVGRLFSDATDSRSLYAAGWQLWLAISQGEQRRSIRLLLQTLSLAITEPDVFGTFAESAVRVMVDPIHEAYERSGFTTSAARSGSTLLVSGLRGLCQDLLITGDDDRVDAAARVLITAATSAPDTSAR